MNEDSWSIDGILTSEFSAVCTIVKKAVIIMGHSFISALSSIDQYMHSRDDLFIELLVKSLLCSDREHQPISTRTMLSAQSHVKGLVSRKSREA